MSSTSYATSHLCREILEVSPGLGETQTLTSTKGMGHAKAVGQTHYLLPTQAKEGSREWSSVTSPNKEVLVDKMAGMGGPQEMGSPKSEGGRKKEVHSQARVNQTTLHFLLCPSKVNRWAIQRSSSAIQLGNFGINKISVFTQGFPSMKYFPSWLDIRVLLVEDLLTTHRSHPPRKIDENPAISFQKANFKRIQRTYG